MNHCVLLKDMPERTSHSDEDVLLVWRLIERVVHLSNLLELHGFLVQMGFYAVS
jgi:hypothetical protein